MKITPETAAELRAASARMRARSGRWTDACRAAAADLRRIAENLRTLAGTR